MSLSWLPNAISLLRIVLIVPILSLIVSGDFGWALALFWFAIFGWSLAIDAHILRHALSVSMSTGVLIAVVLLAATYMVLEFAFR